MSLDFLTQKSLENSLLQLDWSQDASIRSGNGPPGVTKSSILRVGGQLNSSNPGIGWSGQLDSLGPLADVLGNESAAWSPDLSDLIGLGVIRSSSPVGNSDV